MPSNKSCWLCSHLQRYGTNYSPYTWYACDEIKRSITADEGLFMSYEVVEIRKDRLKEFYCKYFKRKKEDKLI